ncbi:MAG: aminodeoxychorismate/anthranilate synthase component II [Opitutales bacterium]|nr:aminodeoxychorismate/anthranilate synthase component II [Opitutales bacterium]
METTLIIDNYDSFTQNLAQILEEQNAKFKIVKNDGLFGEKIGGFSRAIISPGPGVPEEAGGIMDFILKFNGKIPILGVCLGHQAICRCFGAKLENIAPLHGLQSGISFSSPKDEIFEGVSKSAKIGHYHSWTVSQKDFPKVLEITALDSFGQIAAVRVKNSKTRGLQFHPESIMSDCGTQIIKNFLKI